MLPSTITIIGIGYYIVAILFAWNEGRKRTIGFIPALLVTILLPALGILIVESFRLKNGGCKWCGNKFNEATFCGLCGKDESGTVKPGFIKKTD